MKTESKIARRKMFFAERLMHVDGHGSAILKACIMIRGPIREENFRSALSKLQEKHSQLRMRIEGNYFVFDDNVPPIPLRIIQRTSDTQWKDEMESDIKTPIDYKNGPLVRFIWLRSEERSDIIVITTHTIMDGISIEYLFRELMTIIENPEKSIEKHAPILSLGDILPGIKISRWEKLLARSLVPPASLLLYLSMIGKKEKPVKYCELEWSLTEEETAALKKATKKHGVQHYSLQCIAMAKAFSKYHNPGQKKRKVFMSLDIRRYIPAIKRDMMFAYAPMLVFNPDFSKGDDYWQLTHKFGQELIYKAITEPKIKRTFITYPIPEGTLFTEQMHGLIKPLVRRNLRVDTGQDFNFVNLGMHRYSSMDKKLELEMIKVGSTIPWYNSNLFYICEVKGMFCYNLSANTHLISEDKCLKIRDEFMNIIHDILASDNPDTKSTVPFQ